MVEALPFQALMYDLEAFSDLSALICPPYDVISDEMREDLYRRNSFNIVRLEYAKEASSGENKYDRAARDLQDWMGQGVLKTTEGPSFYLLNQNYTDAYGAQRLRKVLMAKVRLVPFSEGSVLPHEYTIPKAKKDRLELLTRCETNFSPIMAVYRDSGGSIGEILESERVGRSVVASGVIPGEGEFTLAEINEKEDVVAIAAAFQGIPILIADGHHRYETALEHSQRSGEVGAQYVMMGLIGLDDPGLDIYGYHRVVSKLTEGTKNSLMACLLEAFEVYREVSMPEDAKLCSQEIEKLLASSDRKNWDVALLDGTGSATLLRVRARQDSSPETTRLPIRLLEECLAGVLGDGDSAAAQLVDYDHDVGSAVARVRAGDRSWGFIMGSLEVDLFEKVVISEGRLPRKSTYFSPKLPTGVVMYPLWGD